MKAGKNYSCNAFRGPDPSGMSTTHTPTHFDPAAYEIFAWVDNKSPGSDGYPCHPEEVKAWRAEMTEAFKGENWSAAYHCAHCGNGNVRFVCVVEHLATKERLVFGCDCADAFNFKDRASFQRAKIEARMKANMRSMKQWRARCAFLSTQPELAKALETAGDACHAGNTFAKDVESKLNKYGSLSEAQVNALISSLARDYTREADKAARVAADALEVKGDAPEGRQEVTGVVLTVREPSADDMYPQAKMLVKLANNSKVWCSVPKGLDKPGLRGQTITFTATFQRKAEDRHFAFGKRPSAK